MLKTKKLHSPANRKMKAFGESCAALAAQAGLILLFAEKCLEAFGADERNRTGILTPASDLIPPSRLEQWHWNL
jgi:hypothetical protein